MPSERELYDYYKLVSQFGSFEAFNENEKTKNTKMAGQMPMQFSSARIHPGETSRGDAAQFDIIIRRNTKTIVQDLQVAIFGFANVAGGYQGFVLPVTGGTVTVTGSIYNTLPDRYRFTHVSGANTDTIDILCNQAAYPTFLQNAALDMYELSNIRYSISDATAQDQFSNTLDFRKNSIFGLEVKNQVTPISFRNPMDEQNTIIDIPLNIPMDKETFIVHGITSTPAMPFEVTLNMFCKNFFKYNANGVFRQ